MKKQEETQKKQLEKIFKDWSSYDLLEKLWAVFVLEFTVVCIISFGALIFLAITGKLFQ